MRNFFPKFYMSPHIPHGVAIRLAYFLFLIISIIKSPLSVEPSKSSALFAESEGPTQRGSAAWHHPHSPSVAQCPDDAPIEEYSPWSPDHPCEIIDDDFAAQPSTSITILVSPEHFDNDDEIEVEPEGLGDDDDDAAIDEDLFQLEELRSEPVRRNRRITMGGPSSLARSGPSSTSKVCQVCNKTFSRAWSLQRHMSDRHFYVPQHLACDVCGRTYRSRNSLISHKSQYHGAGISSKIMGEGSGGSGLRLGRSRNGIE